MLKYSNISHNNVGGFTLIELMVVVIIIGIIGSLGMPKYTAFLKKYRLETASRELVNSLREGATVASNKRWKVQFVFNLDTDEYHAYKYDRVNAAYDYSSPIQITKALSDGVTINSAKLDSSVTSGQYSGIAFMPVGTASGSTIKLTNGDEIYSITVLGSGRVKLYKYNKTS